MKTGTKKMIQDLAKALNLDYTETEKVEFGNGSKMKNCVIIWDEDENLRAYIEEIDIDLVVKIFQNNKGRDGVVIGDVITNSTQKAVILTKIITEFRMENSGEKKYFCEKYFYDEENEWDDEPTIFAFSNRKDRDEYVENNQGCYPVDYEFIKDKGNIVD